MTPAPRSGVPRPMPVTWLVAIATLAGLLGGGVAKGLSFFGTQGRTPDQRFAALERYDSARRITVDSLFRANRASIDEIAGQVDDVADLLGMLVSMQCVSTNPAVRSAVRQTQVPCARVLKERGVNP